MKSERGFTLIELLITILIIGILAAIGLAAYNGQRNQAKNSQAVAAVRSALTAARSFYTTTGSYSGLTPALLREEEQSLYEGCPAGTPADSACDSPPQSARPSDSAEPTQIYLARGSGLPITNSAPAPADLHEIVLCSVSTGNALFCIADDPSRGELFYERFTDDGSSGFSILDPDGAGSGTIYPRASAGGTRTGPSTIDKRSF